MSFAAHSDFFKRWKPAAVLLLVGVLLSWYLVPGELERMAWEIPGMPESYPIEQKCRPIFLLVLSFLPFIGAVIYGFMGTMARYVSRVFIASFLLCTFILTLIWLLADFTDNMERFRNNFDSPLQDTVMFYGTQLPMVMNLILPYTLLMGALWGLTKLSGTSELTGMLQSGRSLMRLCAPILFYSSLIAVVYGMCGFHWAPNATLYRQIMLRESRAAKAQPIMFNNETDARIWRIEQPPLLTNPGDPLVGVVVEQFDRENRGRVLERIEAESAVWDKRTGDWTFRNAYCRNAESTRAGADVFASELTLPLSEKPFQLITPTQSQRPDALGTTAILDLLHSRTCSGEERVKWRTEWHVRIAKVVTCLILVLIAIPSAVTFQRRTTMKGVGIAMLLAALLLFFYEVVPALGSAGILPAWLSAWLPNFLYLGIFYYLFQKQLAHRTLGEWFRMRFSGRPSCRGKENAAP